MYIRKPMREYQPDRIIFTKWFLVCYVIIFMHAAYHLCVLHLQCLEVSNIGYGSWLLRLNASRNQKSFKPASHDYDWLDATRNWYRHRLRPTSLLSRGTSSEVARDHRAGHVRQPALRCSGIVQSSANFDLVHGLSRNVIWLSLVSYRSYLGMGEDKNTANNKIIAETGMRLVVWCNIKKCCVDYATIRRKFLPCWPCCRPTHARLKYRINIFVVNLVTWWTDT